MTKIVLFFAVCVGWASVKCRCTFRQPILWGHDVCNGSIYGPILWVMCKGPIQSDYAVCTKDQSYGEPDACIEDQSYWPVYVAKCTYAQTQVTALCQVRRTSYMGTQHSKSIAVKRRGYVQQYTES